MLKVRHLSILLYIFILILAFRPGSSGAQGENENYTWQKDYASRLPGGMLEWKPEPFVFEAGDSIRYIDFESGNDSNDGLSRQAAWKHHPWDPDAVANAANASGTQTYIFKRGVVYRGRLIADESGLLGNPIRLTSDPDWGRGEARFYASEALTGGWKKVTAAEAPSTLSKPDMVWVRNIGPNRGHLDIREVRDDDITRIPLARTPNWTRTNWDDVLSEWAQWESVRPATGADRRYPKPQVGTNQCFASASEIFTAQDSKAYDGAVVWTEYAGLMGTPYPVPVEEYLPDESAVRFASPWNGKRRPVEGARFFVEGLLRFLDAPGEF